MNSSIQNLFWKYSWILNNAFLTTLTKISRHKAEKIPFKNEHWWKNLFFPKLFLLKNFLKTRRMQIWQPHWKNFAKKTGKFSINVPKLWEKFWIFSKKFLFWKNFYWHAHSGFHNTAWEETTKNQIFFSSVSKTDKKASKRTFSTRCHHGHVKCRFYNSVGRSSTRGRQFFPILPKKMENSKSCTIFNLS